MEPSVVESILRNIFLSFWRISFPLPDDVISWYLCGNNLLRLVLGYMLIVTDSGPICAYRKQIFSTTANKPH